jgi:hypothetical protein
LRLHHPCQQRQEERRKRKGERREEVPGEKGAVVGGQE